MAKHYVPCRVGSINSAQFSSTSPLALAPAMIAALVELTAAERDLDDNAGQDPAMAAYTDAVDRARDRTLSHCAAIIAGEPDDEMTNELSTIAQMIRTVITTDKPTDIAMIRNIIAMRKETRLFSLYRSRQPRYNALLDAACAALAAYIALPETGAREIGNDPLLGASGRTAVAHTEMSRCFIALIGAMNRFVSADQALQRPWAGDVRHAQFAAAMHHAEAELTRMHDALHGVMIADMRRPEDRRLWELGYALSHLIAYEDDDARLFLFEALRDRQDQVLVPGNRAVARRTRKMQSMFFSLLTSMTRLEDFGGPGPNDDGAYGPVLVA